MTPADAPLFAEAVVRPEGDRKEALDSALSKLLATDDPGSFIVEQLDKALTADEADLTYEEDIEPWLGEQAGVFVETVGENADGAVVIAATDPQAAERAIAKAAAADEEPERRRSYKGVEYLADRAGAAGVVGDFVVIGDESAFRDAVDASTGQSLAEAGDFKTQLDQAPDDRVGFVYADPRAIVDALQKAGSVTEADVASAGPQLKALLGEPIVATVSATEDQLALQASAAAGAASASADALLLRDFPDEAWLAFAVPDVGQTYARLLEQVRAAPGSGLPSLPGALALDLADQIARWAGDFGGFLGGTSLFGLSGALVLETSDQQASARTLDLAERALGNDSGLSIEPLPDTGDRGFSLTPAGVPISFQVVQRDDKVVAGLADSVEDVLSPSSTLGDSDAFSSAADALGEDFRPRSPSSTSCRCSSSSRAFPRLATIPTTKGRSRTSTTSTTSCSAVAATRTAPRCGWCSACVMRRRRPTGSSGTAAGHGGEMSAPEPPHGRAPPRGSGSTCWRSRGSSGRWSGGHGSPSACSPTTSSPTRARGTVPGATSRRASPPRRPP